MKRNFILAASLVMTIICAQAVRAEMFSFSKSMTGTIADVRPDAISLTPSSPQAGAAAQQIDLEVNDSTKLKDIQAVTDLKAGDAVEVKYKEQNGRMIATQVDKEESAAEADVNAAGATTVTTTTVGQAGSKPVEERLQVNQGTNQGAANKQDTMTQFDGDSSYEALPNQGQPPHNLGSGDAIPSPANGHVYDSSTTTTTTTTTSGDVDSSAPPAAQGQIRTSDPMPAEGTPAVDR